MSVTNRKSSAPTVKKEIICQVCYKSFKRGKDLKSHSVIHLDTKPFTCDQCPEAFKHKTSLKRHSLIHSGEKPFACRVCGKTFRQKGSLNEHLLTHSGEKPHTCEVCNMGFTTKSNYCRHLRKHLVSKPFICMICNKGFSIRSCLKKHYETHKDEINTEIVNDDRVSLESSEFEEDQLPSQQLVAPEIFVVSANVTKVINHHNKNYVCKLCKEEFTQLNELQMHVMLHVNKKCYVCDFCNVSFSSVSAFCKHKLTHTEGTLSCVVCMVTFDEIETLKEHLETHTLNHKSTCNEKNSLEASDKFSLNNLDKRYICTVCNRTFSKEVQFMHHSVIHKNPGPYSCDICGDKMIFDQLCELHEHYTEHGEIACLCYNCSEQSGDNNTNSNDWNIIILKCDVCYKCFPDNVLLKKHYSSHKNKRPLLIKL